MALLNVNKLSVHFGDEGSEFRAVDRVSYSVNQGEVVGIVGESGSGKSVSSLAIMGLIDFPGRVMAENLEFNGQDLKRISEKERRSLVGSEVAMIFQDPMTSLNPCYTVGFQIMEAIKVHQGATSTPAASARLICSTRSVFPIRHQGWTFILISSPVG
jgi:dipeptide transport system ATP-binding protein